MIRTRDLLVFTLYMYKKALKCCSCGTRSAQDTAGARLIRSRLLVAGGGRQCGIRWVATHLILPLSPPCRCQIVTRGQDDSDSTKIKQGLYLALVDLHYTRGGIVVIRRCLSCVNAVQRKPVSLQKYRVIPGRRGRGQAM